MGYSDADIKQIEEKIIGEYRSTRFANHIRIDGKYAKDDWDDEAFISDNLYEDFLRSVQQGKVCKKTQQPYNNNSTFESYLRDCLETLEYRLVELSQEQDNGIIDLPTYNTAKEVAERATGAIKKFLEKSERMRLIGV